MALGGNADDHTHTETLLALGDALTRAGDLDSARTTFHEAADIARRTGDGRQLARAALGSGGRHQWARPGNDTRLIPLLQDALVMLGGDDDTLRARLLSRLACAWRSSPDRRNDSATLSRQAIEIARGLNDPATLVYTLTARFWATWWPENPQERQEIAEEVLAIAEPLGEGEHIADAHFMAFLQLSELGRIHEARLALADPRAGDRGAASARPGLARARQSLHARPARGGLRRCGGVGGQRGPVDVLDHARARRGFGHANAPLPPAARTGPGVRRRGGDPRVRRRLPLVSDVPVGAGLSPARHSARSPSRAPSSSSWLPASSRRCIATTCGSLGSASRPKPARGSATRRPRRSSLSNWRHSPVVTPSPTPRAAWARSTATSGCSPPPSIASTRPKVT